MVNMNVNAIRVSISRARKQMREYARKTIFIMESIEDIRKLLDRFYLGETTLEEEKRLL
jgi:hypothetical protein